jgi:hypothetical protein
MIRCALLFTTLLLLSNPSIASDIDALMHMQAIAGARNHDIQSEKTGYDYHILVRLPGNYDESESRRYPVIYLLDGGTTFPMLAAYYKYLRFEEAVPEMIVVGISYGSDDYRQGNHRSTDYTAPTDQREYWGGAASFQKALEQEILPLVEGTYRADVEKRIIFGQSIGGQFVLYTALTRPDLFWGHIASNPALHRNLDFFLESHAPESSKRSRLFVARGLEDDAVYSLPGQAWMKHWDASSDRPWTLKTTVVDGYGHFSLAPESFRQGLVWIFD